MNELLIGNAGSGKTHICVERCREAQGAGRPVLYLVPNREEAAQVRRRLLAAGDGRAIFLPEILGFTGLAARILAAHGPAWSRRSSAQRRLQLMRLLAARRGELGILERSARSEGFLGELEGCFRELEEGGLGPADLEALAESAVSSAESARLGKLASLFRAAGEEHSDADILDEPALIAEAARLLGESGAGLSADDPLLIVDGFSDLSPRQFRLFAALAPRAESMLFTLCFAPGALNSEAALPFEGLHALATRLRALPDAEWQVRELPDCPRFAEPYLAGVAARLFRRDFDGDVAEPAPALSLLVGATPRDEVDGLLRELRRMIAAGTAPERLALLHRDPVYGQLLAERCADAGIPFSATMREPLSRSAAVRLCLVLLDWAAAGAEPGDLILTLRGGFVATADALLAEIQSAARERGVPAAASSWDELLDEYREGHPEAAWDWLDWRRGLPERKLSGGEFLELVLRPLTGLLLDNLADRIAAGVAAGEEGTALWEAEQDLPALKRLLGLAALLAVEAPPWPGDRAEAADWVALLRKLVDAEMLPRRRGPEGGGVIIGDPRDLRLPELEAVFVCGLNQGSFPPAQRERTLLREAERQRLRGLVAKQGRDGRLNCRADELAASRYLFYIAATRASRRLWLSWSQRDGRGRSLAPSYYLEEMRSLGGHWPDAVAVPALAIAEKLRDPLDLRSLARDTLLAEGSGAAAAAAAAARGWLEQSGQGDLLAGRGRSREDAGALAGHPALSTHLSGQKSFSASRLEAYANCPFRFLMEKLLGLEEEPDFEPGAREEGSFYHKVLELYFRDWDGETAPTDAVLAGSLAEVAARAIASLAEEPGGWVFTSPRFGVETPRRLRLLAGFLRRDLGRLADSEFRPDEASLEQGFRIASTALPGTPTGEPFTIAGRVDRIDVDPEGRRLVLDYKRGKKNTEAPGTEEPRLFQLALYALAQGEAAGGAAYCGLSENPPLRGYFREALRDATAPWSKGGKRASRTGGHWLGDDEWRDWLAVTGERIRGIVAAVRAGRFAANPVEAEDTCKFCDFSQLCRHAAGERAAEGGED